MAEAAAAPGWWSDRLERILLTGAVAVGAVLSVLTALNQPYNQNEWVQIEPYDSWNPAVITSGTRQPPLDPLLGSLVQHLLGVGQLQQRVVPILAGVGSLVVMALLLRRSRLHLNGTLALWFMATAPLFLRYNGYARPYALPLFLMLLCAYAGTRWLDGHEEGGRRRWLVVALVAAFLLPLARVPEPVAFLGSSTLVLALAGWRRWLPRGRAWGLGGGLLVALGSVGALTTLTLSNQTAASTGDSLIDLNPAHAWERLPVGLAEVRDFIAPSYAAWFPWWPITVLAVVLALALPTSRRLLTRTWWWVPLLLGPLAFLVAYHTVNPYPLELRHYRMRFAYFWVPSLTFAVAAAGLGLARLRRWLGPTLVAALAVSQLPTTWSVLTTNDTNDVAWAAEAIETRVPDEAVVLYDGPSPEGHWRQPFFGQERFFTDDQHARVITAKAIAAGNGTVGTGAGPVWLMVLDAPCVDSVACDSPDLAVGPVEGWEVVAQVDRYTLYRPAEDQAGRAGMVEALEALASAYGPGPAGLNQRAADRLTR